MKISKIYPKRKRYSVFSPTICYPRPTIGSKKQGDKVILFALVATVIAIISAMVGVTAVSDMLGANAAILGTLLGVDMFACFIRFGPDKEPAEIAVTWIVTILVSAVMCSVLHWGFTLMTKSSQVAGIVTFLLWLARSATTGYFFFYYNVPLSPLLRR